MIVRDEPLSRHTTIQIGGPADLFCEVNSVKTLLPVLQSSCELRIPAVVIGGGSNLLVDDKGFRGLIVKFVNREPLYLDFPLLTVSAGQTLRELLEYTAEHSLSGLEFLAGIPGSVGGAVYMNAGAYGKTISELVRRAVIIGNDHELQTVSPDFFQFNYRSSILHACPRIVVSVTLEVSRGDASAIRKECERVIAVRAGKHPKPSVPCAGSYFKNLPPERPGENRRAAGYLLEQAGAKSMKIGGAGVYSEHANIIINTGNATAQDVLELGKKMKKAVFEKYNIMLEEEVRFLDAQKGII
ncbi:hypothetical protein AMJ80_01165 [bacterium SM23_31]|nr:MAG: hypothetical protein AMJ80_01165 [bacterium SM23_31]